MQTVGALYRNFRDAEQAIDDLVKNGYSRESISLVGNNVSGEYNSYLNPVTDDAVTPAQGAAFGAASGGVIGALAGIGALAIPGIGPVIAAGPLIAALTGGVVGAVAGAPTGGIVAGLVHSNYVDATDAEIYAEGVRRGQTLVTVQTSDEMAARAKEILNKYTPSDLATDASNYKTSGWDRFDDTRAPLAQSEIDAYRALPNDSTGTARDYRATDDTNPTGTTGTRSNFSNS